MVWLQAFEEQFVVATKSNQQIDEAIDFVLSTKAHICVFSLSLKDYSQLLQSFQFSVAHLLQVGKPNTACCHRIDSNMSYQ